MNNETIILLNEEEKKQGYFSFGTSIANDFRKLCRRVGGAVNLKSVDERRNTEGRIVWWQCKVPLAYLGKANFSVRIPHPGHAPTHKFQKRVSGARVDNFRSENTATDAFLRASKE